jgi:RHS repeat-associated protein
MRSSNSGGTVANYTYDALNRLATVTDGRLAAGVTTYAFDSVGNLASFAYPNGIRHTYAYNSLNRLTSLAVADQTSSTLVSYSYTLGPAGNRTSVAELSGRRVDYTYDSLYRLTVETITGAIGGTTTYTYDPVGNRSSRSSPTYGLTFNTYDANDRLGTDSYDSDGNTVSSGVNAFSYDFENHLIGENNGAVTIMYDGDGNRVAKTLGGVTTRYLVDDRNLTGYAQVLEELTGGAVQRVYTYGLNRISQSQVSGTSFYGYDGHGSVRILTDATGAVTDRYDYDAFGNIISQAGTTSNVYLYSGEQNDSNLGLYYLRARYLSQSTGRFWTMDNVEGDADAPISLHKYMYVGNEPVLRLDPGGNQFDVASIGLEIAAFEVLSSVTTVHAGGLFAHIQQASNILININRTQTTAYTTMGTLTVIAVDRQVRFNGFSLEPSGTNPVNNPWPRLNAGSYGASIVSSRTFHGSNVLLLDNTGSMTAVEIHPGNNWQNTEGCILPGMTQSPDHVQSSDQALTTILDIITTTQLQAASHGQSTKTTVTIR